MNKLNGKQEWCARKVTILFFLSPVSRLSRWLAIIICVSQKNVFNSTHTHTHARTVRFNLPRFHKKTVPTTTYYNDLNLKYFICVCSGYLSPQNVESITLAHLHCFFHLSRVLLPTSFLFLRPVCCATEPSRIYLLESSS